MVGKDGLSVGFVDGFSRHGGVGDSRTMRGMSGRAGLDEEEEELRSMDEGSWSC